jgi:hypothetical protein
MLAGLTMAGYASELVNTRTIRFGGFAALILLALYVNEGIFPVVLMLVLALPAGIDQANQALKRLAAAFVVVVLELLVHYFSSFYGDPLPFRFAPFSYMPDALTAMLDQLFVLLISPMGAAVLGVLVAAALALAAALGRSGLRRQVLALLVLATASVVTALSTTALEWTEHNLYDVRYWAIPLLLLVMSGSVFVASWIGSLPWPRVVSTMCSVLLAAVSVYHFGLPSLDRMERSVLEGTAYHQPALRSLGCTSLIGDPWQVWTSAFASRVLDPSHPIKPITARAESMPGTQFNAADPRREHYCGITGDANYEPVRKSFSIPRMRVARRAEKISLLELD